jgi:tellurite resistance protein TerB
MFGKLFGKKVTKTLDAVKKFENKDLAEAAIGAAMLIASADGEVEDSELQTLQAVVTSMDQFKHHQSEIGIMIDKYAQLLKAGALIGKMNIMREIADCRGSEQEIEDVLAVAITIAGADGEFEPAEVKVLKEIAVKLNFPASRLADFGVPV